MVWRMSQGVISYGLGMLITERDLILKQAEAAGQLYG